MKYPTTSKACLHFLGAFLLLSLLGMMVLGSLDAFTDLWANCKCQWGAFHESLYQMHPHRTVFPN